jgi:Branched-chain amino acid transport protein (AzlD)
VTVASLAAVNRGAPLSDECRHASLARVTAHVAGLCGTLFPHGCELVDRAEGGGISPSISVRPRRSWQAGLRLRASDIRARSCDAGIFRRNAGAAVGGSAPCLRRDGRVDRRRHCRTPRTGMVVHHCGFDHRSCCGRLLRRAKRMHADLGTFGVWIAIAAMAMVTYVIRAGGFWLMGYVPLTQRVRSVLNALPGSVICSDHCAACGARRYRCDCCGRHRARGHGFRRNDLLAVICEMGAAVLVRGFSL